jgi:hypothetical protein
MGRVRIIVSVRPRANFRVRITVRVPFIFKVMPMVSGKG